MRVRLRYHFVCRRFRQHTCWYLDLHSQVGHTRFPSCQTHSAPTSSPHTPSTPLALALALTLALGAAPPPARRRAAPAAGGGGSFPKILNPKPPPFLPFLSSLPPLPPPPLLPPHSTICTLRATVRHPAPAGCAAAARGELAPQHQPALLKRPIHSSRILSLAARPSLVLRGDKSTFRTGSCTIGTRAPSRAAPRPVCRRACLSAARRRPDPHSSPGAALRPSPLTAPFPHTAPGRWGERGRRRAAPGAARGVAVAPPPPPPPPSGCWNGRRGRMGRRSGACAAGGRRGGQARRTSGAAPGGSAAEAPPPGRRRSPARRTARRGAPAGGGGP
jgi:hypothetical protein